MPQSTAVIAALADQPLSPAVRAGVDEVVAASPTPRRVPGCGNCCPPDRGLQPIDRDIENNRRVPSEAMLRQICELLPTLDIEDLLGLVGRFGGQAEEYLTAHPMLGTLLRHAASNRLNDHELWQLIERTDEIIRERDETPET